MKKTYLFVSVGFIRISRLQLSLPQHFFFYFTTEGPYSCDSLEPFMVMVVVVRVMVMVLVVMMVVMIMRIVVVMVVMLMKLALALFAVEVIRC